MSISKALSKRGLHLFALFIVGGLIALVTSLAQPYDAFCTVLMLTMFCLPGLFIGRRLFGAASWKRPEGVIFGCVFGIVLGEYAVLTGGYIAGWSVRTGLASWLMLFVLILILTYRKQAGSLLQGLREWERGDWLILEGMLLVLLIFVAIPFLNFGKLTKYGYAFTWLFGFDFILRGSYVAGITLGLPPDFLHLAGIKFRYYLVSYAGPAFAYSLGHKSGTLMSVLLIYTLLIDVLFVACLFTLLRHFITGHRALGWTAAVAMVGYSYYGWYVLAQRVVLNLPPSWRELTLGRALLDYGDVSHLFQRLYLVEPQASTGLCLILAILFLLESIGYEMRRYDLAILLGIGLGIEFGVDALLGLIFSLWFGISFLLRWAGELRLLRREIGPVVASVLSCTVIFLGYFAVGMYSFADSGAMTFEPYHWILRLAPIYFIIEFGPMVILGGWGLSLSWKNRSALVSRPLVLFAILILAQVVFVRVGVLPRERLAERLLPIVLLVWTGHFFEEIFRREGKDKLRILAVILIGLAIPTFFTDIRYTSDVQDPARTGYVTVADMQACKWIRHNLPDNTIVQSQPNYNGRCGANEPAVAAISLIPNFAERRETIGEWYVAATTIVHTKDIEQVRARDISLLFEAQHADQVERVVAKYGINYIYVGSCDEQNNPQLLQILQSNPLFFHEVYSEDGVHIFNWILHPDSELGKKSD